MDERLNRYLARSGVASRRAADALIASGRVLVNGRRPPAEGRLIDPERDRVTVDGVAVEPAGRHLYLALNKPAGVVVTASDPQGRPTIYDLLGEHTSGRRLFYVGRLDADTRGLLLVTDDGELANRLAHPRYKVPKEYLATVRGVPSEADLRSLGEGVELEDGRTQPAEVELLGSAGGVSSVRITIREGRNRQVRRMLSAVGHEVRDLQRTAFGPLRLGRLKEGTARRLRPPELDALLKAAGVAA